MRFSIRKIQLPGGVVRQSLIMGSLMILILMFSIPLFAQSLDRQARDPSIVKKADADLFNVIFTQSFDETTPGRYIWSEWQNDWKYAQYSNGVDKTDIVEVDGNNVMKFNYPEGALGPNEGGGQWLSNFGSGHDEVYFSWNMMLRPGFEWVLGGKLPGLGGGSNPGGGKTVNWDDGFSVRIMWDRDRGPDGTMFFYVYHQDKTHAYGDIYGFGSEDVLDVSEEIWYNMTVRICMNSIDSDKLVSDPENAGWNDGVMEFFLDGKLVYSKKGMRFRNLRDIWVDTQHITSFFGGGSDEWRCERTEWILLDDFFVYTYKDEAGAPGLRETSKPGRILQLPNLKGAEPDENDTEAPTVPTGLRVVEATGLSISLTWDKSTDNVFLEGYRVFMNDEEVGSSRGNSYIVAGLLSNTSYNFKVTAFDASSNESAPSVTITGSTVDPDLEAPTTPTNLRPNFITDNSITVEWDLSTDNIRVDDYQVYLDGAKVGASVGTSYSILNLFPNTDYSIAVSATDPSGNESPLSAEIIETTTEPDTEAPSRPENLEVLLETQNSVNLAWSSSTDNLSVAGYNIRFNGVSKGTVGSNSAIISGLDPGIQYSVRISAFDYALNESDESDVLLVKTKNPDIASSPAMPDVAITEVTNQVNRATTVSVLNSFGYADLKDYGIQVSKEDNSADFDTTIYSMQGFSKIKQNGRINSGLQLMYDFSEGQGDVIKDISGSSNPIDLYILDPLDVSWLPGRGLSVDGETVITHVNQPDELSAALIASNALTMELWVKPSEIAQSGPARIFSLSSGVSNRAVTVGQSGNLVSFKYVARLNSTSADENGIPEVVTDQDFISLNLQHVVYTRNSSGIEKLYVNGIEQYSGIRTGNFSSWESDYRIVVANEYSGDRPWFGTYYLAAIYDRALDAEEVDQNFSAGLGEIEFTIELDLDYNVSYNMIPFARTEQGNIFGPTESFMIENVRINPGFGENENSDTLRMAIFPNPSQGVFNLQFMDFGEETNIAHVRISDQSGKIFFAKQIVLPEGTYGGVERLDLSGLVGEGMYYVILIMGQKSVAQKLILQ